MSSFSEFLEMGGYAAFVWPAFGVAAAVMAGLLLASWRSLRSREAAVDALEKRREGRGGKKEPPP